MHSREITKVFCFSTGSCEAAIFENEINTDGKLITVKKTAIQKRYKDPEGEWKSSYSLDKNEIPKMILALSKAYEYLIMGESNANDEAKE